MREGVSGEIMTYSNYSYNKLEPAEARTNASKIKGPAQVMAQGKLYMPREKCLGKSKVGFSNSLKAGLQQLKMIICLSLRSLNKYITY